ncbi:MAG: EAL domain-containing protein [Polyangiaceae bacterium]
MLALHSSPPKSLSGPDPKGRSATGVTGSRANVLVADDDPSFVALVERYLVLAGFHVHVANDGGEALEMLKGDEPDVLLADIGMPRVDGIDLARAARQQYPDMQVVLMTADPTVRSAMSAVELGALCYLAKPFERKDLILTVERAVTERGKAHERRSALGLLRSLEDERRRVEARKDAFEHALGALWIAYQPIFRAADDTIFGCEALLRSDDSRISAPAGMLEAAEQLGEIHKLGRVVRALAAAPFLGREEGPVLFVNLHSTDLLDDDLYSPDAALSRIAGRVVLEITERAPLDNIQDLVERTTRLRRMGFRLAIDDLGAGYAAMWIVAMLEPEIVKLDMSLVRNVHENRTKSHIVRHLVGMAHDSAALVVAEGIETEREKRALTDLGCDYLQGYLLGKPGRGAPLPPLLERIASK